MGPFLNNSQQPYAQHTFSFIHKHRYAGVEDLYFLGEMGEIVNDDCSWAVGS